MESWKRREPFDDFIYYCQQLKGPEYRYTGGRDGSDYEYCQQYDVDCSGMFDVVLRYMGLKGEDESWGTVAIASYLVGFDGTGGPEPYDPDKLYPKGTVIVNDNATDWGDPSTNASHVAMIVEDDLMVAGQPGQRIIHSRPPEGVADWETDYQTHYDWQSTWPNWIGYEWAGFLPELPPDPPPATETDVSLEQLQSIMPNLDDTTAQEYLPHLNTAIAEAEITTTLRQAAFLAQLAHESVELCYMEEIWGPREDQLGYEGREDLGNFYEGDGPLYKGRGLIQLTGRHNYTRAAGEELDLDLVDDPECVATPEVGFRIACWFWNRGSSCGDLNLLADEGTHSS